MKHSKSHIGWTFTKVDLKAIDSKRESITKGGNLVQQFTNELTGFGVAFKLEQWIIVAFSIKYVLSEWCQ